MARSTTLAKAKSFADCRTLITLARPFAPSHLESLSDDERAKSNILRLNAIRKARKTVNNKTAMSKLFNEYAEHFHNRPGGYTRVVKAGYRDGDNAAMAVIAFVYEKASSPSSSKGAEEAQQEDSEQQESSSSESAE